MSDGNLDTHSALKSEIHDVFKFHEKIAFSSTPMVCYKCQPGIVSFDIYTNFYDSSFGNVVISAKQMIKKHNYIHNHSISNYLSRRRKHAPLKTLRNADNVHTSGNE